MNTGISKAAGKDLFGGEIVGIGGEYDSRYAIVKWCVYFKLIFTYLLLFINFTFTQSNWIWL